MQSKINELGVFCGGLGCIMAALTLWLMFAEPTAKHIPLDAVVIAIAPGAVLIVLGALVLLLRNAFSIWLSVVALILGLALESLSAFHVIKLLISAVCIILVVKTTGLALDEVRGKGNDTNGGNDRHPKAPRNPRAEELLCQGSKAEVSGDHESAMLLYLQVCQQFAGTESAAEAEAQIGVLKRRGLNHAPG
jgi:hypothetical protein